MNQQTEEVHDIGWVKRKLDEGYRIARAGWNGKGMWLQKIEADDYRTFGTGVSDLLPWVGMKTADDKFVPWLCSQTDFFATDWVEVD